MYMLSSIVVVVVNGTDAHVIAIVDNQEVTRKLMT